MPERKALMCQPVASNGYVVPGAVPEKCSKCGDLVWVSPSSLLILHDRPDMEIVCMPCAVAEMKKGPDFEVENITPAQAGEIQEYFNSR